ncbi:MAG: hypothetical protein ACXWT4_06105 [Methylobacter sp.]
MSRNLKAWSRADIARQWGCSVDNVTRFVSKHPLPEPFLVFSPELGKNLRVYHEKEALEWMSLVMALEPHRFQNGKYRKNQMRVETPVSGLSNSLAIAFLTGRY